MEGEAKMNKVKKVVAAVALQFSVHTDELTRSIQGLPCFFTAVLEYVCREDNICSACG